MNLKATLLLTLSLCISAKIVAAEDTWRSFSHITIDEGLNWDRALDIFVDESGSIWIDSGDGISLYDGRNITTFAAGPDPVKDFHTPGAKKITGNGDGTIYICGPTNLCAFDKRNWTFRDILKEDVKTICYIEGRLYLAQENMVRVYDEAEDTVKLFFSFPQDYTISSLDKDNDGSIWVGTEYDGLFKLDLEGKILSKYETGSRVTSTYIDSRGAIWIGTVKNGIVRILPDGTRREFKAGGEPELSPASDFVRCFCEDNLGNIWIGTFSGLDCYVWQDDLFQHYSPDPLRADALTHNSIWCIKKDGQGTMWVGTFFGGVNYFNPEIDLFKKYPVSETDQDCLRSSIIGQMKEDSKGNLWIATEGGGLHYLDRTTGNIKWYDKSRSANRLSENNIKAISLDESRDKLWAGTHVGGLNCIDLKTDAVEVFKSSPYDESTPKTNIINALAGIGDSLYVGSTGGLDVIDKRTSEFIRLPQLSRDGVVVSYVNRLFADADGVLWIQMESDNVLKYWPRTGKTVDTGSEEFPALQDSRGDLWTIERSRTLKWHSKDGVVEIPVSSVRAVNESLSSGIIYILTGNGLYSYDCKSRTLTQYNHQNEASISKIRPRSMCLCSDGTIFIGGTRGLVSIHESSLSVNEKPYSLFFTKLYIGNEEVKPGDQTGILESSLPYCDKIKLSPSSSTFTIEFASSNHLPSGTNDFKYRMSGVTEEWTSTRGHNFLVFTNLRPGNYLLELKPATDGTEICNPISLMIQLPPKWYGTTLSWIVYFLLAFVIVFMVISFFYSRKRAADIEKLNQAKLKFFTNISHEIRTPLTIITAEIESIIQQHNCSPSLYNKVLSIYKNCQSLKELLTELLEFRKQEQGEMKIKAEPHDLVRFTNEFFLLYSEYAESKGVKLEYDKDIDRMEVWYDQKQMMKVLNNLLSNALKFTEPGDKIKIHVFSEGSNSIIEISDTGCGIPESELENIFKRFYQVDASKEQTNESRTGTGIGLALARGIIELHKGSITATSTLGKGATFRISLPLGYSHFTKDQISEALSKETMEAKDKASSALVEEAATNQGLRPHRIVIAEDNDSVREILEKLFSPFYSVVAVRDGQAAWEEVQKMPPALVLSDVLMPRMTGTELCKKIKSDTRTCDIPVVLLTARVAVEQTMEGLLTGADDYVTKPFNSTLLLSRCNNLVNSRIKLLEKYSGQPQVSSLMLATNELDKTFIDRANQIVLRNIDNPDFNLNVLAREIGLSRSGLFKKIKAISGQTPNDFILDIRLKQAAVLLRTRPELNVTEISEKIGFNSPRYFAKCFKEKYEMNPLAYRNAENRK